MYDCYPIKAVHGFCPDYATRSMTDFALYYASPFLLQYDSATKKYVPATLGSFAKKLYCYGKGLVWTGMIHSLYLHFPNLFPLHFGGGEAAFDKSQWYSLTHIFKMQTLWHNLCFAGRFLFGLEAKVS